MRVRTKIAIVAIPAFVVAACSGTDNPNQAPVGLSPITSVAMHRSACEGVCPVYTINIYAGGEIDYEGDDFVQVEGHAKSHVSQADLGILAAAIAHVRLFDLRDRYSQKEDGCDEVLSDAPSIDIVVTRGGDQKKVSYNTGCVGISAAHHIRWLADTIDEVADTGQWVGSRPAKIPNLAPPPPTLDR